MIDRIGSAAAAPARSKEHAAKAEKIKEAGREFEAIFVRTMLRSSPIGQSSGQYGEMALDGVARAVTAGKGLGLAEMLSRALGGDPRAAAPAQAAREAAVQEKK